MSKNQKTKLLLVLFVMSSVAFTCEEKQEKSLSDNLLEVTGYTLINTAGRCGISSKDNANYFTKGTVVSGTSTIVDRIDTQLPEAGTLEIYYPRGTSTSLPVIVLFPGGNVNSSFYSRYAARIAADGYAVYIPNRCTIFFGQYFLKVSSAAGNEVYALSNTQNADASSPLFGRLNPERMGYLGHSLGGVTSIYALNGICQFPFCDTGSAFLSQVKVAAVYGAGLTTQLDASKIRLDASGKATPVAYLQGSLDTAFPPKDGQTSYDNYKSTKYLIAIEGANHYNITDVASPTGANLERNTSLLTQDEGLNRISQVTILLLNGHLKSNATDLAKIQANNTGITGITVTSSP
jgi:dienelactone hydrolase